MKTVYCKKCGLRAISKCPHTRNIFPDNNPFVQSGAQGTLEQFLKVIRYPGEEKHEPLPDGTVRWLVGSWTYAKTEDEAIMQVLTRFLQTLGTPGLNFKVAACVHEWELLPGQKCDLGCHVGPLIPVPEDPYFVPDLQEETL